MGAWLMALGLRQRFEYYYYYIIAEYLSVRLMICVLGGYVCMHICLSRFCTCAFTSAFQPYVVQYWAEFLHEMTAACARHLHKRISSIQFDHSPLNFISSVSCPVFPIESFTWHVYSPASAKVRKSFLLNKDVLSEVKFDPDVLDQLYDTGPVASYT